MIANSTSRKNQKIPVSKAQLFQFDAQIIIDDNHLVITWDIKNTADKLYPWLINSSQASQANYNQVINQRLDILSISCHRKDNRDS